METLLELRWLFGHNQGNQGSSPLQLISPRVNWVWSSPSSGCSIVSWCCFSSGRNQIHPSRDFALLTSVIYLAMHLPFPKTSPSPKPHLGGESTFSPEHEQGGKWAAWNIQAMAASFGLASSPWKPCLWSGADASWAT